ncbi:MAG: tyrosine--tRNA ligase [Patescibacteria group bacterium]|nr:tyrosine--tRNA ligase [Patescibacteria group bacterium]
MTLSEELTWRGFANQTTYKDMSVLDGEPITFYLGIDPSADSLQVGNFAITMMVKHFIKHGHKAVLLVGGATGMIGDPDGKKDERNLKTLEEIDHNKQAISRQYQQIFDGLPFELVDNYDWFKDVNYLDFLRDTGKHVPMRQMLSRDFVNTRLGEEGTGISYAEFSYVLIQAYDFLHLYEQQGATLQVCGSDQWGNSIAGVDLIRRKTGAEAHVYSSPLIINKSTGQKFGKTEDGAVWLDPAKTTPTQFYQFWINTDDTGVEDYLKIFTELDKATIDSIVAEHNQNLGKRVGQQQLATSVTELVHGKNHMETARRVTAFLTGAASIADASYDDMTALRTELATVKTTQDGSVSGALVDAGLANSNSEARRLILGNAISSNGNKITRDQFESADFVEGRLLLKRGKAFKDTALIEIG